jgi:NADH-quinone oxidoreductase subunit I
MKVIRPQSLSILKKLFLVDLIKGLLLTFSYQRPSANYTEQYPKVRPRIAERFRGAPRLNNSPETGETLCIACNLCALACPEYCIEVAWDRTEDGKKALTTFTFDLSRCMFCGLCEDACPTPCLELTQDFELALYGRNDMKWDRQKLEEGNQPVIYTR